MNRYRWVKLDQVKFWIFKKFPNLEIRVDSLLFRNTADLIKCHHLSTSLWYSGVSPSFFFIFFFITSEPHFHCLLRLTFFSLQNSFSSNFSFHEAFPDCSVNILYLFYKFYLPLLSVQRWKIMCFVIEVLKSQMLEPDFLD